MRPQAIVVPAIQSPDATTGAVVLTSTSSRGMRRGRRASSEGVNLQFFSERETQPECLL